MLSNSDADLIKQKESPIQNLTFKSFFAILSGCGIHPTDSEEFYGNYGLLNRRGKYNINAYLLSDNNDVSVKVVIFDGKSKIAGLNNRGVGRVRKRKI